MTTEFREEMLDEILQGAKTEQELFGPQGIVSRLTAAVIQRALQAELGFHLACEKQQLGKGCQNRRNGSTSKTVQSSTGPLRLQVPRDREGTFEPQIVGKHQRRLRGFDNHVLALYARGMSVRQIQQHLEQTYGTDVSPELISRVTDAVYDELQLWQSRPLDRVYAVLWLDALMVKMRGQGGVQSLPVYVVMGLDMDGTREVLGLWMGESGEGAKFWMRVLSELRTRGVQDVLVCCCDGLTGFPAAIEAVFPASVVQTCIVHQVRQSLSYVSYKDRKALADAMREIYTAQSEEAAHRALDKLDQTWSKRYPMIAASWRRRWTELTPFLAYPAELRRMVYTTNTIESLHYQLRKVIKTKGHFPTAQAAMKVLYLALRDIDARRKKPMTGWKQIYNQLIILFGQERVEGIKH